MSSMRADKLEWQLTNIAAPLRRLVPGDARDIGIDLPTWLQISSSGTPKPSIMFCAMDPLRPKSGILNGVGTVGMSFALDRGEKAWTGSDRSNHTFFRTFLDQFDVYITDVFKIFFRTQDDKVSNQTSAFAQDPVHRELLQTEIEVVNPRFVVCLGRASGDAMKLMIQKNWKTTRGQSRSVMNLPVHGWAPNQQAEVVFAPHISWNASKAKRALLSGTTVTDKPLNIRMASYLSDALVAAMKA